ncbi:MAG TPA: Hsp70 family protein [Terriglobales bacterium]
MAGQSRYLIGIDLGTTNSAVAYVDTADAAEQAGSSGINTFDVAQLTGPGEVRAEPLLPSFLYFPTIDEITSGAVNLPWEESPPSIVGAMAREQGALVPGRQVSSAKSWLCQSAIDRTADTLPRDAEPPEPMVSPVEASARYLLHLRNAWNYAIAAGGVTDPQQLFENQEIVLTVPASFDAEARELTVEAARQAGLRNLTLLEEPLAAFYAWVAAHQNALSEQLRDGELVLICDIGGGTSDFSLVRAHVQGCNVEFERTAIGEHLLLGGENLDLALARRVEQKLDAKLSVRQRRALRITCSAAKERLLGDDGIDRLPINILGGGRSVVGQMLSSELTRDQVVDLLADGFLPLTARGDMPASTRAAGLREIGLPYASDPAITKHLAAFLRQAAMAMRDGKSSQTAAGPRAPMARPDAILFNGGFCIPAIARERIADAIAKWFGNGDGWRPKILRNEVMSSAVAIGAAYYGRVRRGAGLRVKAGSARTYYIGMRSEHGIKAVCVLPYGTNEGTTLPLLDREFSVLANRPVSFHLYSSTVRHDAHGEIADLDPDEAHHHAPLVTLLRYGKKLKQMELAVRLSVSFTEVGTLELWCESASSEHRWRLQFELRREASATDQRRSAALATTTPHSTVSISEQSQDSAVQLIRRTFAKSPAGEGELVDPASLVTELEEVAGIKRESWPIATSRLFCDVLLEVADGRKLSPRHEVRWLNLLGYCLRPGFGDPQDSARITQARRIYSAGLAFPRELQSQVDWLVLWRRIAGGLSAAHQHELRNYLGDLGIGRRKAGTRLNSQIERDGWRLLASLEHLSGSTRAALGSELLRKLKKEPTDSGWLWSLGRFGARIPLYGSLSCVVPAETASEWVAALLELRELTPETASAILQLGRRVDDRARDISPEVVRSTVARLKLAKLADDTLLRSLHEYVAPTHADVVRTFGEPLPKGLELESTANCLSPVTALTA